MFRLFDSVHTFDLADAKKFGIEYLPLFIPKELQLSSTLDEPYRYSISCIGTDHDGRSELLRNHIIPQCKRNGWTFFFRLKPFGDGNYTEGNDDELFISDPIGPAEYELIQRKSRCLLDIDRPMQTSLTPRFVWALANSKKIITTNENFCKLLQGIVSKEVLDSNILLIDRTRPIIPREFVETEALPIEKDSLGSLYIQNWVNTILE